MRRFAQVGVALALGVPSAPAHAQDARSSLTWEAPETCPLASVVEARIAERVDIPFGDVRVRISESSDGFHVDMSTDGANRSFVAPTCDDAATAVAVIVSLAAHAKAETTADPAPAPEAAPPPRRPAPPAPESPPREAARLTRTPSSPETRWSASIASAFDTSTLPHPSPGVALSGHVRHRTLAASLVASAFLPETEHSSGDPAVQTTITFVDVLALGCGLAPLGSRFEVGACLGGGVGVMHGSAAGIDQPHANAGERAEGALVGRLEWTPPFIRRGGALVRLEVGAVADPVRRPFRVSGLGDVYRPPAVALRVTAGVDVPFW